MIVRKPTAMNKPRLSGLSFVVLILALLSAQSAQSARQRWTLPASSKDATLTLPRLGAKLALDGKLAEWKSAARLPLVSERQVVRIPSSRKWIGAEDIAMEFYAAWTPEGLCLAADVTDDDVYNDQPNAGLWKCDCLEIFVDGRTGDAFHTAPYADGAYQITVKPPVDGKQPVAILKAGEIKGLEIAGARTKTGYTIEALIPWSAFPGLKAGTGAAIGLSFQLGDNDKRHNLPKTPLILNYGPVDGLSADPGLLMVWKLADRADLQTTVTTRDMFTPGCPVGVEIRASGIAASQAPAVRWELTDPAGKVVVKSAVKLKALSRPWDYAAFGSFELPAMPATSADGVYQLGVTFTDKDGKVISRVRCPILNASGAVASLTNRIAEADVPGMAQKQPYKAAAYLGAVSCVDRLRELGACLAKKAPYTADGPKTVYRELSRAMAAKSYLESLSEAEARLDVLGNGKVDPSDPRLLDLLNLTADPEAQVVVEYPQSPKGDAGAPMAWVELYCGSVPLAMASVVEAPTEQDALKTLAPTDGYFFSLPVDKTSVTGLPAVANNYSVVWQPFDLAQFAPDRQFLLINKQNKSCLAVASENLGYARADSLAIMSGCPQSMRQAVEAWAAERKTPILSLDEALKKGRVLLAGPTPDTELGKELMSYECELAAVKAGFGAIKAVSGKRMIEVTHPSRPFAEKLITLIAAGKPITPADADGLRAEIVKGLAPSAKPVEIEKGLALYAGELHSHTIYSDGSTPPTSFALEMLYCFMDFGVISDHDTIEGAQLAQKRLKDAGFAFPLIVGEEITTWYHMNAYPLREVVSSDLPLYDAMRAAHSQGAVTQWNHPGFPSSEWANKQMKNGLAGTGFDAWEHIPMSYDTWKESGRLPTLVGTSDTHNGTFGWSERTVILAPSAGEYDVAESVRWGRTAIVSPNDPLLLYGNSDMTAPLWAALADGKKLKEAKAERIKQMLKNADMSKLFGTTR